MVYVQVSFQFVFCAESHITLRFANLVRTDEVRCSEMAFQILVFLVVHVLVLIAAKMAGQVVSVQMIEEG